MATKEDILRYLQDINYVYNDSSRHHTLQLMLADMEKVVRCKNCRKRKTPHCPMCDIIVEEDRWNEKIHHRKVDYTEDDGYCDRGVQKDE